MRRLSSSAKCIAALSLLLPLAVGAAAVTPTLVDLVKIVLSNEKPLEYTVDMHGEFGDSNASIRVEGTENGHTKTLKDAKADATLTLDFSTKDYGSAHAKIQARLADQTLFLRLDEISVSGQAADFSDQVKPFLHTWVKIPVDAGQYGSDVNRYSNNRVLNAKKLGDFFVITREDLRDNVRYTVTLDPRKQRALAIALVSGTRGYSPRFRAEARRSARTISIDFKTVIETLVTGVFDSVRSDIAVQGKNSGKTFKYSLHAATNVLSSVPVIDAPTDGKTIEELLNEQHPGQSIRGTLGQARDAQRRSDVNTILNAMYQYSFDHNGSMPIKIPSVATAICKASTGPTDCANAGGLNLRVLTGSYIVTIPADPQITQESLVTGYTMMLDSNARITVSSPMTEYGPVISITR
jgi:type IV pilus assembly protein PilA